MAKKFTPDDLERAGFVSDGKGGFRPKGSAETPVVRKSNASSNRVDLIIHELIPGRNTREHFWTYKKRRDNYQSLISTQTDKKFIGQVQITLTRYSSGEMDYDNLVSCGKPVLDAIKRCGIIEDDKHKIVGQPTYKQVKVPRKVKPRYEIIIEQLPNE